MISAMKVKNNDSYHMWTDGKGIHTWFDVPHECKRCGRMTAIFLQPWHQASGCQFCAGSNHE